MQLAASSSTYQWIALGQGSGMSCANMFVVYPSASGSNVTLSPRLGTGHVAPKFNDAAKVTLLSGSTVGGGKIIANIKCEIYLDLRPNFERPKILTSFSRLQL